MLVVGSSVMLRSLQPGQ